MTDNSGNVVERYEYDAYGKVTNTAYGILELGGAFSGSLVNRMGNGAYCATHLSEWWEDPTGLKTDIRAKWVAFPEADNYLIKIGEGAGQLMIIYEAYRGSFIYKVSGWESFKGSDDLRKEYGELFAKLINEKSEEIRRYPPEAQARLIGRVYAELILIVFSPSKISKLKELSALEKLKFLKAEVSIPIIARQEKVMEIAGTGIKVKVTEAATMMKKSDNVADAGKTTKTVGPSGVVSAEKYLEKHWDKATFGSIEKSIEYHVAKHGKGMSSVEYTRIALKAFSNKNAIVKETVDNLGRPALRIISKEGEGLFTKGGKIIWFQPK